MMKQIWIDLFCGAGGTTTGLENAVFNGRKIAKVIACVNHDHNAIASHSANHPDCQHYLEDIRTLNLEAIQQLLLDAKLEYPEAEICLWASLECTNFSNAQHYGATQNTRIPSRL